MLAFFFICSSDHRRLARLGDDVANLRQIGALTGQHSSDNLDKFWTFSWRPGVVYQTTYPELNTAADYLQAAANQAVYLLRTHGGRPAFPQIYAWIPHIQFSSLVLADYADQRLPWRLFVSSGDRDRLKWSADPACFDQGCFLPCQPNPADPSQHRWPYAANFQVPTMFFDLEPVGSRITQAGLYNQYYIYGGPLGPVTLSEAAYPSQKVFLHDQMARHFGDRQPYCTHEQARLPLLMLDGSVSVRSAADSNLGWDPNMPSNTRPLSLRYSTTNCWEPPSIAPAGDTVLGRFRYTRGALQGRDFGGRQFP